MEITKEDLIKRIESVSTAIECTSKKPDLISFYEKYSSSFNKAVIEVKKTPQGLKIVEASDNIKDIMGYSKYELINTYIEDYRLKPFDQATLKTVISLLDSNEVINKKNSIVNKRGNVINTRGIFFKDGDKYVEFIWLADDEFDLG